MLKILALIFLLPLFIAPQVFAKSNLETASDSNFANITDEFSTGQTIYVKVTTEESNPTKKDLNLRDNNYQLLKTYVLNQQSNNLTTSFAAPNQSGIYSLEAKIEGDGFSASYVQTVQVGESSNNVNSNVNVNVNVQGTKSKTTAFNQSSQTQQLTQSENKEPKITPAPSAEPTPEISQQIIPGEAIEYEEKNFFQKITASVKHFFLTVWNFSIKKT